MDEFKNYRTLLNEKCQRLHLARPQYDSRLAEVGGVLRWLVRVSVRPVPAGDRVIECECEGYRKTEAGEEAARQVYEHWENED